MRRIEEPKYMTIKEQLKSNDMMSKWNQPILYPDAERYRKFIDSYREKKDGRDHEST